MKALFTLTAWLCLSALLSSQEIKRPTSDATSSQLYGCTGSNQTSTSMPKAYDLSGLSTSSSLNATGTSTATIFKDRLFTTWQNTLNSYSSLSLNVNASGTETNVDTLGEMCIKYSSDAGSTWNTMFCTSGGNSFSQTTYTASLSTSQDLSKLRVAVCAQGTRASLGGGVPTSDTITVYDIWTSGVVTGVQPAGPGSTSANPHRSTVIVN